MEDDQPIKLATLNDTRLFFGMTATQFGREWKGLTDLDKGEIRRGIADGTFNYTR